MKKRELNYRERSEFDVIGRIKGLKLAKTEEEEMRRGRYI